MHGSSQADAILHLDNSRALRDAADRAVEHLAEQDARDLQESRGFSDVGRLRVSAAARPASVNVTGANAGGSGRHRQLTGIDRGGLDDWHEPGAPAGGPARTCCSCAHCRSDSLAVRQLERSFRAIAGFRVAQLPIPHERRRTARVNVPQCTQSDPRCGWPVTLMDAPGTNISGDQPERRAPWPTASAFHRDDLTVIADDIEIDIRMRVDEEPCKLASSSILPCIVEAGAVVRVGAFDEHRVRSRVATIDACVILVIFVLGVLERSDRAANIVSLFRPDLRPGP